MHKDFARYAVCSDSNIVMYCGKLKLQNNTINLENCPEETELI